MAESIDKKQLEEIATEAIKASEATDKLQKEIDGINASLKKLDTGKLNDVSIALEQSGEAAKEATKNSSEFALAMDKVGQVMPNIKTAVDKITKSVPNIKNVIDGISKKLPDVKKSMEDIYKATESTEKYFKSFNYYTDTFAEIASKWDEDFENYGSENAKRYANTFIKEMNESLGKLSGMSVSLSVDMESGILTESGMKDLGLNVQEVTQFAAEFASISNSMGQTGDVSLATADAFTKLAGDMSSYYNVDYSTVVEDLQEALLGQSDVLERYRINLSDAKLQTYAYANGLEKLVEDMTQTEKMQLSMIAILDQSKDKWGNLADNINTPANTFRELANNCKEVVSILGQLFMPVLEQILPIIDGVAIAIQNLLINIASVLGIDVNLGSAGTGTDDVAAGLESNYGKETVYTIGASSSISLVDGFLEKVSLYEEAWNQAYENMDKKSQEFANKVTTFLEPVKSIFSSLAIGDYVSVGQNVGILVISITDFLKNAIDSVDWHAVGERIGEFLEGINWTEVFSSIGELIGEAINSVFEVLGGVFDTAPLETGIVTAIGLVKWSGLGKAIASGNLFKSLATLFAGQLLEGKGVFSKLVNVFALTIGDALIIEFDGIDRIVKIVTAVSSKIGQVVSSIGEGISNLFYVIKIVLGAIVEKVSAIISIITGGISNAISTVGTFLKSIVTFLQPFAVAIAGVVAIIAGIALAVTNFVKMFQEGFNLLSEVIMLVGIALVAVGAVLLGAPALVAGIVVAIVAVVSTLVVVIHENWEAICAFFLSAVEWIHTNIIVPVGEFFSALWIGIGTAAMNLWEGISVIWAVVSAWFSINVITPLKNEFKNACDSIGSFFIALWSGIKSGLASSMNAVIGGIESGINFIINGVNRIIRGFNEVVAWVAEVTGENWSGVSTIATVKLSRIAVYATGGFPEDGWFRASHGEIMGRFDNGQSVVANNMQITNGIASAVYPAVYDAMMSAISQNSSGGNVVVQIDGREVFKTVRKQANNYTRQTGLPAFNY